MPTHRELPVQTSLSEFIGGNNADCGPDAELMGLSELGQLPENAASLQAIDKRDAVAGWFSYTGGEPISSIVNDLNKFATVSIIDYVPYNNGQIDLVRLHNDLMNYAGTYPIIIEINNAQAMPGNEQGVHTHFIMISGIDSTAGYEFLNGDDINALKGLATYPSRWMSWQTIQLAQPIGCVVFMGRKTVGVPTGWKFDGTTLTAPNGGTVSLGFKDYILNRTPQWPANLVPVTPDVGDNSGDTQQFMLALHWDRSNNSLLEVDGAIPPQPAGDEEKVKSALAVVIAAATQLNTVVNSLNSSLASLETLQASDNT